MGRPRGFSEETVLNAAAGVFIHGGYEATSIDDLVKALNLHRGSLYKAFGSKRGLFLAVLRHYIETQLASASSAAFAPRGTLDSNLLEHVDLDLLLIAALERGHRDAEVAALVRRALGLIELATADPADVPRFSAAPAPCPVRAVELLGARLYNRLHNDPDDPNTPH